MIEIVKKIKIYDFKELDQNIQENIINDFVNMIVEMTN